MPYFTDICGIMKYIVMKSNEKRLPRSILKGSSSNSTMNSTAFADTMHDIDIEATANSDPTAPGTTQPSNPFESTMAVSASSSDNVVPSRTKNVVTIIAPPSERPRPRPRQGSLWSSFQSTISRKLSIDHENIHDKEDEGDSEPMQRVTEINEQQQEQHEEEDWNLSVNDFCIDPNLEHAVPYDVFSETGTEGDIAKVRKREVNPLILFLREEGKKAAPKKKNRISMGHKYPLPGDIEGDDFDEIREIDGDDDEDDEDDEQEVASCVVQHQDSHGDSYAGREVWKGDRLSI